MPSLVTDNASIYFLGIIFGDNEKPTSLTARLFIDQQPLSEDNNSSTRIIASGGGYEDKIFSPSATITNILGVPTATFEQLIWTFTSGLDNSAIIYGIQYLSNSLLLWEDIFSTPFKPNDSAGGILKITPRYRLGNGTII